MILALLLISTLAGALALWMFRERLFGRGTADVPAAAPRASRQAPATASALPPKPARALADLPDLVMIEWDDLKAAPPGAAGPAAATGTAVGAATVGTDFRTDPLRRKLRDRYIQARFPGVVASGADLEDGPKVVKAVRLYFEEGKLERADELLELAIEQTPGSRVFRLAQLELAFLRREAPDFIAFAREFRAAHPAAPEWTEICRLGRVLSPADTSLFGGAVAEHAHGRYGPWPDLPNWLHASWDLTAGILAADLHREMASPGAPVHSDLQRSAS